MYTRIFSTWTHKIHIIIYMWTRYRVMGWCANSEITSSVTKISGRLFILLDGSRPDCLEYSCWCWACPIDSTSIIVIRGFFFDPFLNFFCVLLFGFNFNFVVVIVYYVIRCRTNSSFLISSSAMEHMFERVRVLRCFDCWCRV